MDDLASLLPYATERQREAIQAYIEAGSYRGAARALGVHHVTLRTFIERAARTKAQIEASPVPPGQLPIMPAGHVPRGVSTMVRNPDPKSPVRVQWIKTRKSDEERFLAAQAAVRAMCEEIVPEKPVRAPEPSSTDLLNTYIVTDYHIGMLAWPPETGEAWDVKIAEDLLVAWFERAIATAPDAYYGVLAQLGDFLHWDGLEAVTVRSGNVLDADTRFTKIVRIAIRVIRRIVAMLLAKHQHVHIIMAEGNHDPASSVWLRELCAALYENEPRVTVDTSPDPYYCYEFGNVALFFHHGHLRKVGDIETVFAAKFRQTFGHTKYAYAHMGHLHHDHKKEGNLMTIEQHCTLAARDAYATRGGWLPHRGARVITYHRRYGKIGELELPPEMLEK